MPEVVGAFSSTEPWHERTDRSVETGNSALGDLAEQRLEFAVGHLDGIEIGRVLRQVAERGPRLLNRFSDSRNLVGLQIIHHDNVVAPKCWSQALLDVGSEYISGHGAFDHHRCDHFVVSQAGHEGDRFPISERNTADQSDASGSPPLRRTRLVLTAVSSINTRRAGSNMPCSRIQRRRARTTSARSCSAARRLFFEGDVVSIEKPPKRTAAGSNSLFAQLGQGLFQGQIRLLGNQSQYPLRKLFQWRNTSATRLWRRAPDLPPALQPSDRRTRTDLETLCRFAPRSPRFHSLDHSLTQVPRIRSRHRPAP